ncbi:MAG: choice-of-anchor J domain-containing protein, partial [Crocinitomicaceae bacterium]|nr:choice-of-anchor J domain-containing protein [Crocinitomicaceae bacterium]
MKNFIQKSASIVTGIFSVISLQTNAQITENFDVITTLAGSGWVMQNNSVPVGSTNWFQGNGTVFAAFNGASDSYIGANFNNTTGANTISNWLVTPNVTIKNGDVITFYTHASPDNMWADNLQVRMSTNGASTNVGTGSAAVGDFTTLLLEINPTLSLGVYPYLNWQQFTITISGLSAPTSGRFAFRYYVPNGGPSGTNSDYIGIDNFVYTPYVCPVLTVTPSSLPNGTAGSSYNQSLSHTNGLGTVSYSVTAGALPPGTTLTTGGVLSGTP